MSLCRHCHKYERDHFDGWCPFAPTHFVAMTAEELAAWITACIDRKYPQFKPGNSLSP